MAGDSHNVWDDPSLKGFERYFNSTTMRGRFNFTVATYSAITVIGLFFWLKPKKIKEPAELAKK